MGLWRDLAGGRGGSISSWVHGVISPSRGGDEDGDRFMGSWRDLADGRGGSISSWVRGVISLSRGGDEDSDQFVGSWRDLTVAWRGRGR